MALGLRRSLARGCPGANSWLAGRVAPRAAAGWQHGAQRAASSSEHDSYGDHNGHSGSVAPGRPRQKPLLWLPDDGRVPAASLLPHDFSDCSARGIQTKEMLRELRDCGVALLTGCPEEQEQLLQRLGAWLGGTPLAPAPDASSQGSHADTALGTPTGELRAGHEPPAVLAVSGAAASTLRLVDGFAAVHALQATSPAAFDYLSSRPLPWRHQGKSGSLLLPATAPVLQLRADGTPESLRWSLGDLQELAPSARSELQPHTSALAALLGSGRFERRLRLRPGELLLLDTRRVLVGADGASLSGAGPSVLRFGLEDVERVMRQRGLLPVLEDNGTTSPKVRVMRSPQFGYYALAAAPIAEGEPLFSVDLSVPDGRIKAEPSLYSIQISENQHMLPTLVPDELGGLIRYPSHMSNPSLRVRLAPGTVEMVARRRLDAGEELGFNYCSTEWSMASPFVDNRTKASVQGFRHLPASEQQWLFTEGLVAPHLQRLVEQHL